ncbi:MAG: CMP/dCMP deaminase zinc-binding protein [Deferribacteraceae bacterium]|jgi:tRNA(adenine34) deaminase|nr:CMP/dCMP deaminase zinc-binding protein [Deferribacteraceae bacterium]
MQIALNYAKKAFDNGDVPVGAIVVKDDKIIGNGFNIKEKTKDPTQHAEIVAMREAANVIGDWRLNDCTLYSTLEPCIMCAGAILHFRINRVVFGVAEPKFGGVITKANLFDINTLNHKVDYAYGIYEEEIKSIMRLFFKIRRSMNNK